MIFEVSDQQAKTFTDLTISRSANYAEHKRLGREGLIEFTGLNAGSCTLKCVFDESLGVNPKKELEGLEKMMKDHEAAVFVLDGALVGSGYWVIESLNSSFERIDSFGGVHKISADITLKEYIR